MWWQLSVLSNVVVASAYFGIAGAILVPLIQTGQLRTNRLGAATAAIFFTCAVGHGMHAAHAIPAAGVQGGASAHMALWDVGTAVIGVYYWTLRRIYGSLMRGATLFEDMEEQQRVAKLEAAQAIADARAEAERDRDAHAAMLRSVIANSQSLIYIKDLEGRYLLANEPFQLAFGVREADLLGRTDESIDPESAGVWRANDRLAERGPYRLVEWSNLPDGPHVFESTKFPLYDGDGRLYATCGVSLDVTESRRAAKEIADARDAALAAAAAKATFLATMSHEIRTPMNAVIGMTGLLLDTPLDPEQRDYVETVRSSGDALLDIINDILDYSKIDSGHLQTEAHPFDLTEAAEAAVDLLAAAAAAKGLDLVCQVDPRSPRLVVGDLTRFRQVVVNLLSNAVKFTPAGEVLLTVAPDPDAETDTGAPDGALRLWVTVADTGIGIPRAGVERLFTAFTQVDTSTTRVYGGTGLGLAISRRLVEAMGGELTVTSTEGVGSTFTFSVVVGRADDSALPELEVPVGASGRRVLIVDDNPTVRRTLRAQLEAWGMHCTEADGAQAALDLAATGAAWDLAMVDEQLPDAGGPTVPGLGTALRAGPAAARLPLVLLTVPAARAQPVDRRLFRETLSKPVKAAALRDALTRALNPGASIPAQGGPVTPDLPERPGLRILYAEDNLVNQKVGRLMLGKLGRHHVDTVGNGHEAVAALLARPYDVVLMDVQMPELDGREATRLIRSSLPAARQPRIVAITASALAADREACRDAGMDDYLAKPVREAELRRVLAACSPLRPLVQTAPRRAPAIDLAVLDSVLARLGGEEGAGGELLAIFVQESTRYVTELVLAAAADDAERVGAAAHAARPTSAMLGAARLADLLLQAEETARGGIGDLGALGRSIGAEHEAVLRELAARRVLAAGPGGDLAARPFPAAGPKAAAAPPRA